MAGGVAKGVSGDRGRGTVSWRTLVRSVRILAIMKRLAGGVVVGELTLLGTLETLSESPRTERSKGAGLMAGGAVVAVATLPATVGHLVVDW